MQMLRSIPWLQVYVHHYVSSYHFLLGNGAELRGSFTRPPLPSPYAMIVNGTEVDNMRLRMTNIQLINTGKLSLSTLQGGIFFLAWCMLLIRMLIFVNCFCDH